MEQHYITSEIRNIPVANLKSAVADIIEQTVLDYGKNVSPEQQIHVAQRAYQIISSPKHRGWQWIEVVTAFERGKIGIYGGESRISVAGIERWMNGYGNDRMKRIVEIRIKEQQKDIAETRKLLNGNEYAEAITWKNFKCSKDERQALNALRETGLDVINEIVSCRKKGLDPRELISEKKEVV